MRKLLIILLVGFMPLLSLAQITLEHTYSNGVVYNSKVTDSSHVYFYTDSVNVYIFSSSHASLKTVAHGDSNNPTVYYLSQELFDSDSGFEFIVNSFHIVSSTVVQTFKIMNDDGSIILSGLGYASPFETPNGAKLAVRTQMETKIYDLPGTHHSFGKQESSINNSLPYPNPSSSWVRLPYNINSGNGKLSIVDMSGRERKTYSITATFTDILLQPGTLPPGQYYYYVEGDGQRSEAKPFIIK